MAKPLAPCQNCPDRHENCWPSCEKFQEFSRKNEKFKANIAKGKQADLDWGRVRFGDRGCKW